ncbi:NADH dehydrogenase [ubiquinone] 1 alpha subcomplex assembly factor 2 isoform X3 [Dendrobates tinctorius]|uniref:NADH dehydrogenase [ubiquinone] 1 alpha subcomplex assembly factor 2 isoform X3 n=1 Tax=Dendrobates tinctorius TaxID=92724 RepID=UPI003CC99326
MDKLRSLLQRTLGTVRHHMGTDQYGNKYYYVPEQRTWTAWIRGKRKDPPTNEEILKNEQLRKEISAKGEQLLKIDEAMSHTEGKHAVESMRTQIKGHASAPVYEKPAPTEEPTSTANTFVPGSWNPQKK